MNRAVSIALGLLALVFANALRQPQWNPFTTLYLLILIAVCAWFSVKFWNKGRPDM